MQTFSPSSFQIGSDTSVTDCVFRRGVMHGPARKIEMRKFREFRRQLTFFGRYRDGRPWGNVWIYKWQKSTLTLVL